MEVYQKSIKAIHEVDAMIIDFQPELFILFISPTFEDKDETLIKLTTLYPESLMFGCSTAGEIMGDEVMDSTIALTAIQFNSTKLKLSSLNLGPVKANSKEAGKILSNDLQGEDLRHILVLSDGLNVNGAELVKGLNTELPKGISVTGGLAGDGAIFGHTFVIANGEKLSNCIVALGLYGKDLKIGYGSQGGWDSFGVERLVTRSIENVLYELDGKPALELYKSFLGDKAAELPGSGLLFPLSMRDDENKIPVVRTILGINEEDQSLTFAGNIHQGSYVRLMKANVDRLINGAEESAIISKEIIDQESQFALLVSCVGRRLVLKQLVDEELEVVKDVLGEQVPMTGFYSYGEIAPFNKDTPATLHNQTMTITTFAE